jgi:hypothetical protein
LNRVNALTNDLTLIIANLLVDKNHPVAYELMNQKYNISEKSASPQGQVIVEHMKNLVQDINTEYINTKNTKAISLNKFLEKYEG